MQISQPVSILADVPPDHTFFSHPSEFEPLLPERRRGELAMTAAGVITRSLALVGAAHPTTIKTLRGLLREMNSYYSNRIEGQSTHPLDIARALRSDYSTSSTTARLQRLALAHIRAELLLEGRPTEQALQMGFLQEAHAAIYAELPIDPGQFRTGRVVVGRHIPP
jgi:Fic family protein